jgi:acyl-CoA thioester hydrolase
MDERFVATVRVRWAECDPQNVASNDAYFVYLDVAQSELWRTAVGPWDERRKIGIDTVLHETRVRYRAPARFEDLLEIVVRVARLGTTSVTLLMEVTRDGEVLVEATSRYVLIDLETFNKVELPQEVREGLTPYLVSDSALDG